MSFTVSYTPGFEHQDWVDNVDRVRAGGDNGFNGRFHALEAEFARLSQVVTQINTALNALGQPPAPQEVKTTLLPVLVATSATGWTHNQGGFASKIPNQTSAHGMMNVDLPDGARILSLRATGRITGAGSLRVALFRQGPAINATAERIARIEPTGDPFDVTGAADSQFQVVDTDTFRYYITALLDNAQGADAAVLTSFQIAHITG